ncbi:MAG TPA: GGDEF domain-containing protein [Ramlibacter sp.]|nr:GGDEF domain-containing protein [Ramlibacter sp.]
MSKRQESIHPTPVARRAGESLLAPSAGPGHVTFRTGRLEPRLAWGIAAFTVWAAIVLSPGDPVVWMVALYAAAIGGWCRVRPAHREWLLLTRAALLLAGGFVLQVGTQAGGLDGPFFIWPIMVVTIYSLLLGKPWSIALWVLALVEFTASRALATAAPAWQLVLAEAGILAFFAWMAMEFGRTARELDRQAELARRDSDSRLYNEAGFFEHGGALFDDCRRRRRPFSMVLLNSADLREVADLVGKKATNQLFAQLVQGIDAATPSGGLAARTDGVEFGIALPGLTAVKAAALLHHELGQPPRVEVRLKDSRLTVMLDAVIAEATADVATLEDMYDRLRAKLVKRTGEPLPADARREDHSTLQGMLQADDMMPHHARPTLPMGYGELEAIRPRQR